MATLEQHWVKLCAAMGQPELARDPRFTNNEVRLKNQDQLVTLIEQWIQSMPSDDAAVAAMKEHRVPMAPILSVEEAMRHPHLRERGTVRTVHDRLLGDFDVPGFSLRFSDFPQRLELEAPFLGEHNEEILTRVLGYPVSRVRELESKGILRSAPY
jgi:crotonobetainyl-CoA:carnitine CoA-transferase CaiB-like acyl-CoA transferase